MRNSKKSVGALVKDWMSLVGIAILIVVFSIISYVKFGAQYFLTWSNWKNILLQSSTVAIVALGQSIMLLTGNFDLSLGRMVCLTSCVGAILMKNVGMSTGLAILKDGKVVQIEDEPTGGTHLTLVLAGNFHVPFQEAEAIKQDYSRHKEILPVVKAVVEKMASIVNRYIDKEHTDAIYLCGGTCCLTGIEKIFEKETGIRTIKPANPFLVTPAGIAMNCKI